MGNWLVEIKKLGACSEAIRWGNQFEKLADAWAVCERGDWMLWLLGKLSGPPSEGSDARKKLVMVTCQCARLALKYIPKDEKRPLLAIETAEKWVHGEGDITLDDILKAVYAAAYADDAASKSVLKECADIVRQYYEPPNLRGVKGG